MARALALVLGVALLMGAYADQFNIALPPALTPWPADNSSTAVQGGSVVAEANFARVTLGPCTYRMLHLHFLADEVFAVTSGKVESLLIAPNNTAYSHTLLLGDNVVYPKGWNHLQYNPTCKQAHTYIFFNARSIGTINTPLNVAAAGASYLRSAYGRTVPPPVGLWATDAKCLERCKAKRLA
ncbi:hypothetical protein HYH03_005668 [Edaphochlamys debaryana]|uniref:Cupin type-1 domain-containing protein n=1 Tax=Edaphochlamys debaryana TaxID=47281 RepID=A0A835YF33_9CHLO|nr:hypothetical protein HYH03_005668 [Edaphochlamys debaryana]|eukprot:KAG2496444.1 hypothetical protein HYH03_005668 [Edaphochlamys debaryana]